MVAQPHYLLFCDTHLSESSNVERSQQSRATVGRWHFVLEQLDGSERLEAADSEYSVNRERLALLSVVRGLEALEQPSQVTLVTTSRYVSRGLRYGLSSWREADYKWERFGERKPVRNSDLWRRVDVAMQYHGVKCRLIASAMETRGPVNSANPSDHPVAMQNTSIGMGLALDEEQTLSGQLDVSRAPSPPWGAHSNINCVSVSTSPATLHSGQRFGAWMASLATGLELKIMTNWWGLAQAWIRWWRGRMQARPAFFNA